MATNSKTSDDETKVAQGNQKFESTGNWLLDALLRPGSSYSRGTLAFLNTVFYLLFATIIFLMWLKDFGDIHTYVFMFLALGLYFSVRFFVAELKKAQEAGTLPKPGEEVDSDDERSRSQEQEEMRRKLEQEEELRRIEQVKMMESRKDQ